MRDSRSSSSSSSRRHSAERTSISSPQCSFQVFHSISVWVDHIRLSPRLWPSVCLPPSPCPPCPLQSDHVPLTFSEETLASFTIFWQFPRPQREWWHSEKTLTRRKLLWNSKQRQPRFRSSGQPRRALPSQRRYHVISENVAFCCSGTKPWRWLFELLRQYFTAFWLRVF